MQNAIWHTGFLERIATGETAAVEIFVQPGFSDFELSAIIQVLQTANDVCNVDRFAWQVTSDQPGLIASSSELLVRAEPTIGDEYLKDCLFVIGGQGVSAPGWINRVRAMQRLKRPAVLLSDAATKYIKTSATLSGPVTTHWRDIGILHETGDYPTLTTHLVENNNGILTCAGQSHTQEIVIGLLSEILNPQDCAELSNTLILDNVRGFQRDQPAGLSKSPNFFEKRLQNAIALMEGNVETPLRIAFLAGEIGVSTRQLERLFMFYLGKSPAKFYKHIRLKHAQALIVDTQMPLIDVALASGFSTSSSLANSYRQEFGTTPNKARNRKN